MAGSAKGSLQRLQAANGVSSTRLENGSSTPQFESAGGYADGLAPVAVGGLTGYIDRKGRFVINPRFVYGGEFVGGLAQFMKADAAMTNGLVGEDGHAAVESGRFEVVGNLSGICLPDLRF